MPISGRFSYVCLRYTLPIDYLGVGFYGSLVFSASIVPGLNTKVDRAFVPGALFRSGPPSLFAWVGFETRCIFEMGCETRGGVEFQPSVGSFFSRFPSLGLGTWEFLLRRGNDGFVHQAKTTIHRGTKDDWLASHKAIHGGMVFESRARFPFVAFVDRTHPFESWGTVTNSP